jgi:hypothetical protein
MHYATIWVRVGDRSHEVDARPSNAFNLALRVKAPIYVVPEVFEQGRIRYAPEGVRTGNAYIMQLHDGRQVPGRDILTLLEEYSRERPEESSVSPETVEMEWRSFRSLPRGDAGGLLKPMQK